MILHRDERGELIVDRVIYEVGKFSKNPPRWMVNMTNSASRGLAKEPKELS